MVHETEEHDLERASHSSSNYVRTQPVKLTKTAHEPTNLLNHHPNTLAHLQKKI